MNRMIAPDRQAIGQSVSRFEDPRLLTGGGRYTDDLRIEGAAIAVVLRSPYAHGRIRKIGSDAAAAAPGVLAVLCAGDLIAAGIEPFRSTLGLKSPAGEPPKAPERHALAHGKVRYVGEPVAVVVAQSEAQARDAIELIELDIEPLPAVTGAEAAAAAGAPPVWDEVPDNVTLEWAGGDQDAVDAAMAQAAHVTRLRMINNRVVVAAMEPRAAVAEYDTETEAFTLHVGSQGVFNMPKALAAAIFKVPPEKMRVRTYDVGGSFGMKAPIYHEYVAILEAARRLGRPVRWVDDRAGSFVSDHHGRDSVVEGALALDGEGRFLAVRVAVTGNVGAYLSGIGPQLHSLNILKNIMGMYRTPAVHVHSRSFFTHSTAIGAYRGAGRPESNYFMERLVERAARETGRDATDLRRLNFIPPSAIPYTAPSGFEYDSGEFEALFDAALEAADWDGVAGRKARSRGAGCLRGAGIGCYVEMTAPPGKEMGGIRFEADGTVTMITGTLDYGQGHRATFAQIVADTLGLPLECMRLAQGDSKALLAGGGTGGSRSVMTSGNALRAAGLEVIEKGRVAAAHLLEAAEADIEFRAGRFAVAGTDRGVDLLDLARRLGAAEALPESVPATLDVSLVADDPPSTFPNGCHICEVEIDPETGVVAVECYTVVDDIGTVINPMLVEGQIHGGVAQGLGQAILEQVMFDPEGQPLSGSFMDYALPRADDIPHFEFRSRPTPASTNPLGVKGCGEAGVTGALGAIMNAINDALHDAGASEIDMPATPERVWRALEAAKGAGA